MRKLQDVLISRRKDLKLSLRDAGDLIGISHSYLSTLEKGLDPRTSSPVKPTPETLGLISKAYNISYENLMELAGYIEKENSNIRNSYNEDKELDDLDSFLLDLKEEMENQGMDFDETSPQELIETLKLLKEFKKKTDNN